MAVEGALRTAIISRGFDPDGAIKVAEGYSDAFSNWRGFSKQVSEGALSDFELGVWLMMMTRRGFSTEATQAMTRAMAASGDKFDYRIELPKGRLLRRYPTGALSEKIALIMPVLLLYVRRKLGLSLYSPFLIARALGHTGGTRDKLTAIPGFALPSAGDETLALLRDLGVAYIATSARFNPADDRLYSLRSETNTIESAPLIVASIASKMLACPVDLLQLDARWGAGAFFASQELARATARAICEAVRADGQEAFYTLTEANFPSGSGIGARAEVAESIAVMRTLATTFDNRGISEQQVLVADFTARLVAEAFAVSVNKVFNLLMNAFRNGGLIEDFCRLFTAHGVADEVARSLWNKPEAIFQKMHKATINATRSGRLETVDQFTLGEFLRTRYGSAAVVLRVRPADRIIAGQPVLDLYSDDTADIAKLDPAVIRFSETLV